MIFWTDFKNGDYFHDTSHKINLYLNNSVWGDLQHLPSFFTSPENCARVEKNLLGKLKVKDMS